ncbi:MAG: ketoacyl-ACP synthase III [Holosporales bacterium]|jgi:3-oxoacyl-[acyl-carrier-protein] synthase-3|nr:ketoacyl-ACP synthase III [Holosporales bacterium]
MINSIILGVGSKLPSKCLTNDCLAKMVDTSDEWIVQRTGIRQRYVLEPGQVISALAAEAAKTAISNAGISAHEIDLIIVATTTPEKTFPSTAALVQEKLGTGNCAAAFDINAVCSGFVYALSIADSFIKTGQSQYALVIGCDAMSKIVDWNDRSTCVLFGDGAGAMVLGAKRFDTDESEKVGVVAARLFCDGKLSKILETSGGTSTTCNSGVIVMNGREVFKRSIEKMSMAVQMVLSKAGLATDQIDVLIPHQANARILNAVAERLGLDKSKMIDTVGDFANTSAATIPIAWDYGLKKGIIRKNQNIVLTAMGGGVTWGAAVIRV